MLRNGKRQSYGRTMLLLYFDAFEVIHGVTAVTDGIRYSATLYTPGKLERLTPQRARVSPSIYAILSHSMQGA